MSTEFTKVYNVFLSKITDDLYLELTPEDTIRDLRSLLLNSIPQFEFPRKNLDDYTIDTKVISEGEVSDHDFVLGIVWNNDEITDSGDIDEEEDEQEHEVMVEQSSFNADLSTEEINILALLMMCGWVQRQVTSIENTRMKYSGSDFSMTSQANHLSKLMSLSTECQRQAFHMQRLYKRRRLNANGEYESNWDVLRNGIFGDYRGH